MKYKGCLIRFSHFVGWEWEDLSDDDEDKGCENGEDSYYAESEYTKDTPKVMPKALKNNPGVRLAPTPDDFQVKTRGLLSNTSST